MDLFPWDMARYDHWATKPFTKARALDCYAHRYRIHYPYEERDAGRPLRKRPVFDTQRTEGAVFGLNAGWEHPLWYASNGIEAVETCGYERQPWFDAVARECHALRSSVGVVDISNFAKYRISGSGAWQWLDQIFANRIPTDAGRSCLTPLISHRGGIAGDFTVTCRGTDNYMMFGSGLAERYHRRYFTDLETNGLCKPSSVTFESLTDSMAGFNVAGPAARELLQRLSNQDISNDALSFMRSTSMTVAGIDVLCLRVSFTGDLGFELYCDQADQLALYQALKSAGRDLDVASVGGRALLSLRVEKGYGSWGREYSPEYWPHEVGLDKLIKTEKGDFHGKSTWLALSEREPREKLVSLTVDVERADASGGEPVFTTTGIPVGRVSSGAFGHTVGESLAMAMIKPEFLQPGAEFDVAIVGKPHRARLLDQPLFDPRGLRLRA